MIAALNKKYRKSEIFSKEYSHYSATLFGKLSANNFATVIFHPELFEYVQEIIKCEKCKSARDCRF